MKNFISIAPNVLLTEEIVEKKSRFLAFAQYVNSEKEAEIFYQEKKKKYSDARHIVFAYRLQNTSKSTDDGEPSGTAGRPILQVLEKMNLFNIIVVVVRYFGGVKLGAGPLLRAYANSATQVLRQGLVQYEQATKERVNLSFSEFENILKKASKKEVAVQDVEFAEKVTLTIIYPLSMALNIKDILSSEEVFYSFGDK